MGAIFREDMQYLFQSPVNPSQTVLAQTIWTIISSEGDVEIATNGRTVQTSTIQLNDQIILADDAKITIAINDSFEADIDGPARFEIVPTPQSNGTLVYKLKFLQWGDYIAVDSAKESNDSEIAVQTSQGVVIQNTLSTVDKLPKRTSFVIVDGSQVQENMTILNKSQDQLSVKRGDATDTTVVVEPAQIVAVVTSQDTIQVVDTQQFVEGKYYEMLASENLQNSPILSSSNTPSDIKDIVDINSPHRLTKNESTKIEQNLYATFVERDMHHIFTNYLLWERDALAISYANMYHRLVRIADIFEMPVSITKISTPEDAIVLIVMIENTHRDLYSWSYDSELYNIRVIKRRFLFLKNYKVGVYKNIESDHILNFDELSQLADFAPEARQYIFKKS